jgi:hypothetical protein
LRGGAVKVERVGCRVRAEAEEEAVWEVSEVAAIGIGGREFGYVVTL